MADRESKEHLAALNRAADRAANAPSFMAYLLAQWGAAEGLTWRQTARRFGCTDDRAHRLALCRRPRPSPEHFVEDIERIGSYVGIDPAALARLVRESDAVEGLRQTRPLHDDAAAVGLLMAALDRVQEHSPSDSGGSQ